MPSKPISLAAVAALALLAGCGSSNSKSSSSSGGGAYGSSKSASSSYDSGAGTSATPSSTGAAAVITTKHSKLGTILAVGSSRRTVYLWEADKGATSACNGACAAAWPPVLGTPKATGSAQSGDLGTTKRADGTTQVTYKGHPLYEFSQDKDAGDTYGQGSKGFGASWYALRPSGSKVDES